MRDLKFLSRREMKPYLKFIQEQWGADVSDFPDAYVMIQRRKDFNLLSHDITLFDFTPLRINSAGVYFGEFHREELRLSIEGSQLVGPRATKNVIQLDDAHAKLWMTGNDFEFKTDCEGFVLVKHNNDFIGCGKIIENRLLNFVPKSRRLPEAAFT